MRPRLKQLVQDGATQGDTATWNGAIWVPDTLMQDSKAPAGSETIYANRSVVVSSDYEIPNGFVLDVLAGGSLDII